MKSEIGLGYLLVTSPMSNVFIGGLMVVDQRGLPLEFRYSEPIQPTKLQQILYGAVLSRYIKTEVILESLLKSLDNKPPLLVVNDDSFLFKDLVSKEFDVIRLSETKSGPIGQPGAFQKITTQEYLLQLTGETNPVRVQLPAETEVRETIGGLKSLPNKTIEPDDSFTTLPLYATLCSTGQAMDILEPFKRVEKALTALCQEAGIKSPAV